MLQKTRGIVLKTIRYSESSIIAKIYTEHFGLRSYIIKGVSGKTKNRKKALLQGLTLLSLVVYEKPGANLQNIREMENAFTFGSIPFDIRKSTIAMFLNEVLYKCLVEEAENTGMFRFVYDQVIGLDNSGDNVSEFHLRFLIEFSRVLGFLPRNNFSGLNAHFDLQEGIFMSHEPLHSNFLDKNLSRKFSRLLDLPDGKVCNSPAMRNELLEKLILYYGLHLPTFGELKSVPVLKQVLND